MNDNNITFLLKNILHLFIIYDGIVFKLCLISGLVLLLCIIFKWAIKDSWPNGYEPFFVFKITSNSLNYIYIFTYVFIFIILLFLFRIYRMGKELDLKPIINFITQFIQYKEYLLLFILLLIICCIVIFLIGLLKRIKGFFEIELLKRHLKLYADSSKMKKRWYYSLMLVLSYLCNIPSFIVDIEKKHTTGLYHFFITIFLDYFTATDITYFLLRPITFFFILSEEFNYYLNSIKKISNFCRRFIYKIFDIKYFSLIPLALILYDGYYNNFVLVRIFNFLPIYFIYLLWHKTQRFLLEKSGKQGSSLCEIISDMYYNTHEVKYIFMTPNQVKICVLFIRHGLTFDNDVFGCDVSSEANMILYTCQYILTDKDTLVYKSIYNDRTFYITNNGENDRYREL